MMKILKSGFATEEKTQKINSDMKEKTIKKSKLMRFLITTSKDSNEIIEVNSFLEAWDYAKSKSKKFTIESA